MREAERDTFLKMGRGGSFWYVGGPICQNMRSTKLVANHRWFYLQLVSWGARMNHVEIEQVNGGNVGVSFLGDLQNGVFPLVSL